ncbi:MAG: gamma-glutamyltransferase [Halofilum sp. (in: g-proteobacteria)]|nr:gamma-glutamyltransferase [Halofilum sp. (in: g-proteobacteria)]
MSKGLGAVACGHPVTRDAAVAMLEAGGNAYDAVAAALWTACAAEPVLASPGGGGFLLAQPVDGPPRVYDFFAHTPRLRLEPEEADFRPIIADFGTTQQEFHIGLGAAATPGMVAGTFAFQAELGRMPASELMQPAIEAARAGVEVQPLQAYIAEVVGPILEATPEARTVFAPGGREPAAGERHAMPGLGDFIEALAHEGPDLFYRGEVAAAVDAACVAGGGHLRRADFEHYRVERRQPLAVEYRGQRVLTNAPPASGGLLVAFGLEVLAREPVPGDPFGSAEAERIAATLAATQEARLAAGLDAGVDDQAAQRLLAPETVARYRRAVGEHPPARRGTTHISVLDAAGNAAALTVSNGEGNGWIVPGTGFMLNNMLGEADLQPRGFGRWPTDTRLTSMMAPTLVSDPAGEHIVVLGSGGSNRIRSAILQVLAGHLDFGLPLQEAVNRPRLHVEGRRLEIEGGFEEEVITALAAQWPEHCAWPERNLFFGGAHAVARGPDGFSGAGDPRRGGVAAVP